MYVVPAILIPDALWNILVHRSMSKGLVGLENSTCTTIRYDVGQLGSYVSSTLT